MVILLSDLHLADRTSRPTIDVSRLMAHLTRVITQAHDRGVRRVKLVLLGDIFELLKSTHWLTDRVRPWEACGPIHRQTVARILEEILSVNAKFFETLAKLAADYDFLDLCYIPGNHDRPINTDMGQEARALLLSKLPLPLENGFFPVNLRDNEHRLFAHHGHDWDSHNRYVNNTAAIGDAIVIEAVVNFPRSVVKRIDRAPDDPMIEFLYELDNLRPLTLKTIFDWVESFMPELRSDEPQFAQVIDEAIDQTRRRLRTLIKQVRFETSQGIGIRLAVVDKALDGLGKFPGYWRSRRLVPASGADSDDNYEEHVRDEFQNPFKAQDYRYVVCGHTHKPVAVPLLITANGGTPALKFYLNTGTWRRVHKAIRDPSKRGVGFSSSDEECLVTIWSEADQKLGYPPFEFYRLSCARS